MSQRQIAAVMGVSPRTVGRWLREGTREGVTKIPREARDLVNIAFEIHKDFARQAAKEFEIPFSSDVPVFAVRKPLNKIDPLTGRPMLGDRIFIENAQFLGSDLRQIAILDFALSQKMVVATVGSNLNLHRYYQETLAQRIEEHKKSRKRTKVSIAELRRELERSFQETFGVPAKELEVRPEIRMVFTKNRSILPQFDVVGEVQELERQIKQKHEAAADTPGTGVGNVIIVQMKRESTLEANSRIAARETARNRKRGRKT